MSALQANQSRFRVVSGGGEGRVSEPTRAAERAVLCPPAAGGVFLIPARAYSLHVQVERVLLLFHAGERRLLATSTPQTQDVLGGPPHAAHARDAV